jgi:SpoVK/Ycf46/Vps4 family AAA+-type ATPase
MEAYEDRLRNIPRELLKAMPSIEFSSIRHSLWDEILSMCSEKEIIERQIAMPLANPDIAVKHGIKTPKAILLFGPPGTGKTVFAKGISAKLDWEFVEISPSALGTTERKEAFEFKIIFENIRLLNRTVVFVDEFEELGLHPAKTSKEERELSNEFLRQLPKIRESEALLLVCATNNIRMLNPALLRPGRFDIIFPVGSLEKKCRKMIFAHKIKALMVEDIDLDLIAEKSEGFTPADIEAVVSIVSQHSFEKECFNKKEFKATTEDFLVSISSYKPTISKGEMAEFAEDVRRYCRADYCPIS